MDIVGDLPVILMEIDPDNNNSIEKTYIYANGQILAQHYGDHTAGRYFYLHDRLGSVRLIIDSSANVKNRYTYKPFGFTGQWYDAEIGEYFLRARMYDPHINRFTGRDPVFGEFEQPLTLHKYLYCLNDPINMFDPQGEWAVTQGYTINATEGRGGVTFSIQQFYGMSDNLEFFCGYMLTIAGGPEPTGRLGLSGSFSGVRGYSPNAQSPENLGGLFFEVGGSVSAGVSAGGNLAISPTGVQLRTFSFGFGGGAEFHGQLSHTYIFGDWTFGPARTRSSFEQHLTDIVGNWGSVWLH